MGLARWIDKVIPEIQPAELRLSGDVNKLTQLHLRARDRMLGYIKGRKHRGLAYTPGFVRDQSALVFRNTSDCTFDAIGSLMGLKGHHTAAVHTKVFKLEKIAHSTCEGEMGCGGRACKVTVTVVQRNFMKEIGFP